MHAWSREPGALQLLASGAAWALYDSRTVRQLHTHGTGHPGVTADKSPLTGRRLISEKERTHGSQSKILT